MDKNRSVRFNEFEFSQIEAMSKKSKKSLHKFMKEAILEKAGLTIIKPDKMNPITSIDDFKENYLTILPEYIKDKYIHIICHKHTCRGNVKIENCIKTISESRKNGVIAILDVLSNYFNEYVFDNKDIFLTKRDINILCKKAGVDAKFTLDPLHRMLIDEVTEENAIKNRQYTSFIFNKSEYNICFPVNRYLILKWSCDINKTIESKKKTHRLDYDNEYLFIDYFMWGDYLEVLSISGEFGDKRDYYKPREISKIKTYLLNDLKQ